MYYSCAGTAKTSLAVIKLMSCFTVKYSYIKQFVHESDLALTLSRPCWTNVMLCKWVMPSYQKARGEELPPAKVAPATNDTLKSRELYCCCHDSDDHYDYHEPQDWDTDDSYTCDWPVGCRSQTLPQVDLVQMTTNTMMLNATSTAFQNPEREAMIITENPFPYP